MAAPDTTNTTNSESTSGGDQLQWRGRFYFTDTNPPPTTTTPTSDSSPNLGNTIDGSGLDGIAAVRQANNPDGDPGDMPSTGVFGLVQDALESFWSGIKTAGSAIGNGVNTLTGGFLYGRWGGTALLIAGAVAAAFLIYHFDSGGNSNPKTTTPTAAVAALQVMHDSLDQAANQAIQGGVNPTLVNTRKNEEELVYGTSLATIARGTKLAGPDSFLPNPDGVSIIIGPQTPSSYQNLARLNTRQYLQSLSQAQTPDTILENSAAVHGLETQKQKL